MGCVIDVGFLSRSELQLAFEHVRLEGGPAAGPDGLSHADYFGEGPKDPAYQHNFRDLLRRRFHFVPHQGRPIKKRVLGKMRTLLVVNLEERVLQAALTRRIRTKVPCSRISLCRNGLDGRLGVMAIASSLRGSFERVPVRTDLKKAFETLRWAALLDGPLGRTLPAECIYALGQLYGFHSPTGVGVPLGLAPSPALLGIACQRADDYLRSTSPLALRYVDDFFFFANTLEEAQARLCCMARLLAPYGLGLHESKTTIGFTPSGAEEDDSRSGVEWLGHEIDPHGIIDITRRTSERMVESKTEEALERKKRHFVLARQGRRFKKVEERRSSQTALSIGWLPQSIPPTGWTLSPGGPRTSGPRSHPQLAPVRCRSTRHQGTTAPCASGNGRGGQTKKVCPPRPSRNERIEVLGGRLEYLTLAHHWDLSHSRLNRKVEAKILFGLHPKKVEQISRAAQYWNLAKETLWGQGVRLDPDSEEKTLKRCWSVLLAAGTVTEVESTRYCLADPLAQLLDAVAGTPKRRCKSAIKAEAAARNSGGRPTQPGFRSHRTLATV